MTGVSIVEGAKRYLQQRMAYRSSTATTKHMEGIAPLKILHLLTYFKVKSRYRNIKTYRKMVV
jgi:hypothetical protein